MLLETYAIDQCFESSNVSFEFWPSLRHLRHKVRLMRRLRPMVCRWEAVGNKMSKMQEVFDGTRKQSS